MPKQKENWEELIRSDFYPYNVCVPLHSIKYSNEFLGGPKYRKLLLYIKDKNTTCYYENFEDHFRVGKYCLKLFITDKKLFERYLAFWHKEFKKLDALCVEIKQTDLKTLKKEHLANYLDKLYFQGTYWEGVAYNVDAIDATLNPIIEGVIAKSFPDERKSKLSEYYNKLTFPKILSYINRMHLEKLKLFQTIEKTGEDKNKKKIAKFINDYYWVNFTWGGGEEYNLKLFEKEKKELSKKELASSFATLTQNIKSSLKEKNKIIAHIANKESLIRDYINIFDQYAILHDLRKEGQMKSNYFMKALYDEIGKRFNVPENFLYYYWPKELLNVLRKNKTPDISFLRKRSNGWFCEYYASGKCLETYGAAALKKRDTAIGLGDLGNQKELQGTGASSGRISGPAKICLNTTTAKERIKEGDILVTGMTMPDFIPAMKRAAAVVTDEGGLTCHAAIICRELGKPCVVGTKLATRLIKDGAKIEVNANHGVVKIL